MDARTARELDDARPDSIYCAAAVRREPSRLEAVMRVPREAHRGEATLSQAGGSGDLAMVNGVEVEEDEAAVPEVAPCIPDVLPVLPLRASVAYPGAVVSLAISGDRSRRLVEDALRPNRLVALVAQRSRKINEPGPDDLFRVGVAARILQILSLPEGSVRIAVQGLERIRLVEVTATEPYLVARVEPLPDRGGTGEETEALRRAVLDLLRRLVGLLGLSNDPVAAAEGIASPRELAYFVASALPLDVAVEQQILEIDPVEAKLRALVEAMQHEIAVRELGQSVLERTQERLTKAQREMILREQVRSIHAELGEGGKGSELDAIRRQLEEAGLPEEVRREAERELERLASIPEASPEHGLIHTWLDWIVSLPWSRLTGGEIDVRHARQVLDEDHYDLEEVKDRILEHLAVQKLRRDRAAASASAGAPEAPNGALQREGGRDVPTDEAAGAPAAAEDATRPGPSALAGEAAREPILCFVGPPGVGKTSLGQSIARALGRKFVRMSLGGVHDEAEIRGHRRTYIGALPGRIIQGLRRAGTRDPVFMLDEIDKVGADWRGDPTSALLEVLDPAQNYAFTDTYLGVPFDLSQVLFVATANTLDTIPAPLLDRMEVLRIAGYTEEDKVRIALRYLVPQQRRAHGLAADEVVITEAAIREIIRGYTREAGLRNLDRRIAQVFRKIARRIAEASEGAGRTGAAPTPVIVQPADLPDLLGRRRYFHETAERTDRPGVATGLAWTPVGGEVLFVEAAMVPDAGDHAPILTGMLGDVMRESAQAALTYVRSEAERLGIDEGAFRGKRLHVHVPAGAMPKDGPSAGVAIATAIASLALSMPVRHDVAMTGEITLRGKVLAVGGIKEKVLGAHRAGIRRVILPRRNEPDLDDVPDELREQIDFRLVNHVDEVLVAAGLLVGRRPVLAATG